MPLILFDLLSNFFFECQIIVHFQNFEFDPYFQQIPRRRPLVHLHSQTLVQKILEGGRQLLLVLDVGLSVGGDQVQRPQRIFVQVRWFAFDHLDGHDAQRPDVDLRTPPPLKPPTFRGHRFLLWGRIAFE
jgi:hypothetical protein